MPHDLPHSISSFGGEIDSVIVFIWWITAAWFVAAEVALIWLIVKYRARPGVRAAWLPADSLRTSAWILVLCGVILLFDLAIEARSHHVWQLVKLDMPKEDVLVRVTGRQFVWTFDYAGADGRLDTADDFSTINELHVPKEAVVRFQLESHDVLHSFWVPALRLKQDAVPGRSIAGWFTALETGDYEIACAELCGAGHTAMRALLVVAAPDDHAAWASDMVEQRALLAAPLRASLEPATLTTRPSP